MKRPEVTVKGKFLKQGRYNVVKRAAEIFKISCEQKGFDLDTYDVVLVLRNRNNDN